MTDSDLDVVRLAAAHYRRAGAREQTIRDQFGVSAVRFWQRLNALLADPDVEAALPVEVHRLRRLRADRQRPGTRRLAA